MIPNWYDRSAESLCNEPNTDLNRVNDNADVLLNKVRMKYERVVVMCMVLHYTRKLYLCLLNTAKRHVTALRVYMKIRPCG